MSACVSRNHLAANRVSYDLLSSSGRARQDDTAARWAKPRAKPPASSPSSSSSLWSKMLEGISSKWFSLQQRADLIHEMLSFWFLHFIFVSRRLCLFLLSKLFVCEHKKWTRDPPPAVYQKHLDTNSAHIIRCMSHILFYNEVPLMSESQTETNVQQTWIISVSVEQLQQLQPRHVRTWTALDRESRPAQLSKTKEYYY